MKNDIYCDVTEYMDKFRDPKQIPESVQDYQRTYILGYDGKPRIGEYSDEENRKEYYFWYVGIPGYTCANIVFKRSDDTVEKIVLTKRGGLFAASGQETSYLNPDKLEKELNEKFVGKKLSWWVDKD